MVSGVAGEPGATFFALTPDRVLDAVEVGGFRCTGRCLPLRAFENRVYEVELEDERRLVVKFYRPGRWSRETILDEHAFLSDLTAAEVPAVAPIDIGTGTTLSEIEGIYYAVFPKVRGRSLDELDAENRRRIGRTIGRMHAVGASRDAPHRPRVDVKRYISEPLEVLLAGSFIPEGLASRYRDVAVRIGEVAAKVLATARVQRIHGDLHWGNILWTPDPLLVDFDDCLVGPPVQDIWLLARGNSEEARKLREDLARGLRALPRVRSLQPGAVRAAPRHADHLHVRLDRPALVGSVVPAGLSDVPQPQLLESGIRGAGADRRGARITERLGAARGSYLPLP